MHLSFIIMKSILPLLVLIFISACKKSTTVKEVEKVKQEDTLSEQNTKEEADVYFDSLKSLKFDTSTLEGKVKTVLNNFTIEYCQRMMCPTSDTLIDLNFDGHKDLIIYYYLSSGTGLKNAVEVYLFNAKNQTFEIDSLLSRLPNPSYYVKDKTITWFYIAHGGGDGGIHVWEKGKWLLKTTYNFDHKKERGEIIITNLKTKKSQKLYTKDYIMIPPDSILRNEYD